MSGISKSLVYCRDWKPTTRPATLILRAFNIELSRARTVLSQANPSIAAGKFAFWRDVISDPDRVVEHPVAESLQWLLRNYRLDEARLLSIVDAKEKDCYRKCFWTTEELLEHYRTVEGSLTHLMLSTGLPRETLNDLEQTTSNFGIAAGITTLLRNSLKSRTTGLDPGFPVDMLSQQGLYVYDLLDRKKWRTGKELKPIVEALVSLAETHAEESEAEIRRIKPTLPSPQKSLLSDTFLYTTVVRWHLGKIKRADHDLEVARIKSASDLGLQARLLWNSFIS